MGALIHQVVQTRQTRSRLTRQPVLPTLKTCCPHPSDDFDRSKDSPSNFGSRKSGSLEKETTSGTFHIRQALPYEWPDEAEFNSPSHRQSSGFNAEKHHYGVPLTVSLHLTNTNAAKKYIHWTTQSSQPSDSWQPQLSAK